MVQSDHPRRAKNGCGSIWSHFNLGMARILLLWLVIVLYTLFGAAVFSALERPSELEAHCKWNRQLAEFIQDHKIPDEELHQLLKNYEVAVATGIRMEPRRPRWDFSGAFYFVATVVSTIGKPAHEIQGMGNLMMRSYNNPIFWIKAHLNKMQILYKFISFCLWVRFLKKHQNSICYRFNCIIFIH